MSTESIFACSMQELEMKICSIQYCAKIFQYTKCHKPKNINSETINSENINFETINSENIRSHNINSENINSENIISDNINSWFRFLIGGHGEL